MLVTIRLTERAYARRPARPGSTLQDLAGMEARLEVAETITESVAGFVRKRIPTVSPGLSPSASSSGIFQSLLRREAEGFPACRSCGWRSPALPAPRIYLA